MKTYIDNSKRENLVMTGVNFHNGCAHITVTDSLNGFVYQRRITPEFIKLLAQFEGNFGKLLEHMDKESVDDVVAVCEAMFCGKNDRILGFEEK